jgi:hypothetical protein
MSSDRCQAVLQGKRALTAARGGDRDAWRYLFVRFGDDLVARLVDAGSTRGEAEARVHSLFSRAAQADLDPVFGEWLTIEINGPAVPAYAGRP